MDNIEVAIVAAGLRSGKPWEAQWLRYVTERDTKAALEKIAAHFELLKRDASTV